MTFSAVMNQASSANCSTVKLMQPIWQCVMHVHTYKHIHPTQTQLHTYSYSKQFQTKLLSSNFPSPPTCEFKISTSPSPLSSHLPFIFQNYVIEKNYFFTFQIASVHLHLNSFLMLFTAKIRTLVIYIYDFVLCLI